MAGDTNGVWDTFVHDRASGVTRRVSVSSSGEQANDFSGTRPAISANGRYVAFSSAASNLVAGDTNADFDVFVHDLQTGSTVRASVSSSGEQGNATSDFGPSLSADGRYVTFQSVATNLVAGDTNGRDDVFVRDLQAGVTSRVSVSSTGAQADGESGVAAISGSGRYVAFPSAATNLVAGDTNGVVDVFVHDRVSGATTRVSVSSSGAQGNGEAGGGFPAISTDGRFVAFSSEASNLVAGDTNGVDDTFVHDRSSGTTTRVSLSSTGAQADAGVAPNTAPALSADGRSVAFASLATNLVSGDTNGRDDTFVRDTTSGTTTRVSVSTSGAQQGPDVGGQLDFGPSMSADGRVVSFQSAASNLVAGDTNGASDVFVRDLGAPKAITRRAAELFGRRASSGYASDPVNTATGNFTNEASDLSFVSFGLGLTRTYNSLDDASGAYGPGWHASFEVRVDEGTAGVVTFTDVDGRRVAFTPTGTGGYFRPEELFGDLAKLADGSFELAYFAGETWSFDASGRLVAQRNWDGQGVAFTYDAAGRVVALVHTSGERVELTYEPSGGGDRLVRAQAGDGRVVSYAYDPAGNLVSVTDPVGAITRYGLDDAGRITTITDSNGAVVITNAYDATGRVVHQALPSGGGAAFAYDDATGATTVTDDTTGAVVTYEHDAQGHLVAITDPYGATLTKRYDASGNLSSVVDRRSATTHQSFDAHGNVLSQTSPGGVVETFTYDASDRLTSSTDAAGNVTRYGYEGDERVPSSVTDALGGVAHLSVDDGLVSSYTDADGVTTTFAYDARRLLVSSTDALSNATRLGYDAAGRQTSLVTPLGHVTTTTYDAAGRVVAGTDPTGATTRTSYDPAGNVTEIVDPTGARTTNTYDASGNLASSTDANGAVTTYSYDAHGNLTEVHLPNGATETNTYDPLGRLLTSTDALGAVTRFAYDADGNEVSVTDPAGAVTSRAIDLRGRVVAETDALGRVTRTDYGALDRVIAMTDPSGAITASVYDAAGNLVESIDPTGASTRSVYSPAGRLTQSIDALGHVTTYTYDPAGRQTSTIDPLGNTATTSYDADGRVIAETSPTGLVTRYAYDPAGQRTRVTNPAGHTTRTEYSPRGEVVAIHDATGATRRFAYDAAGNLTRAIDANGGVTTFAYDASGNRVAMTDAKGAVTRFTYDAASRRTSVTDPLGRQSTFAYDALGRLTQRGDPSGRTEALAYDAAGQLTSRTYHDGSRVTYAYDPAGRRVAMTDATGTTTYAYDPAGRLVSTLSPTGKRLAYAYDQAGRRSAMTYPDETLAGFTYDPAGRLVGISTPAGQVTYAYDPDGTIIAEDLPGGVARAYAYDAGRLVRYAQTRGEITEVTTLAYDAAGRITAVREAGRATTYAYDAAGQLVGEAGAGNDLAYAYDEVGNRTQLREAGHATTYTYDAADQLTSATSAGQASTYAYDAAGRRTEVRSRRQVLTTTYDAAGRPATMATTTGEGAARVETRTYDGDGTLVAVAFFDGDDEALTSLTWDATLAIPEIATMTTQGHDTDLVHGQRRALALSGAAVTTFAYDALGSVIRDDDEGEGDDELVRASRYDAFGVPGDASTRRGVSFGYRGEAHIGDTVHLRARDYDPAVGRFATPDPIEGTPGEVTVANPYHYAQNDPLDQVDPLGLSPVRDSGLRAAAAVSPPATVRAAVQPTVSTVSPTVPSGGAIGLAGSRVTRTNPFAFIAQLRMFAYALVNGCKWNNNVYNIHDFLRGRNCFPWAYWYYTSPSQIKANFRYEPVFKNTDADWRMMIPYSGGQVCSTPWWLPGLGDTGGVYNFRNACRTHDYAYDILRWCGRDGFGSCSTRWGVAEYWSSSRVAYERVQADGGFGYDMLRHCEARPKRSEIDNCKIYALWYYDAVRLWTNWQGKGIP